MHWINDERVDIIICKHCKCRTGDWKPVCNQCKKPLEGKKSFFLRSGWGS